MEDIKITFAENLKRYRKEKGLSQEELAKASDIAVNSIRSYEQGKSNATLENISRLAKALEITIGQLCDEYPEVQTRKIETYADLLSVLTQLEDLCFDSGQFRNGEPISSGEVHIECQEDAFTPPDLSFVETYSVRIDFIDKTLYDFFSTYEKMQKMVKSENDPDGKETLVHMKDAWVENQMRQKKNNYLNVDFLIPEA